MKLFVTTLSSIKDAELYDTLMKETSSELSLGDKVLRFLYKKTHKTFDYAESLTFIKPCKYKKYNKEDISKMVSML